VSHNAIHPDTPFLRLDIGLMKVAVRSCEPQFTTDLAELYDHVRQPDITEDQLDRQNMLVLQAQPSPTKNPFIKRFKVTGDGEDLFVHLKKNEVLPYLEWATNWRVIARCSQFMQIHAASLSYNGNGLILAATSGSGKSTLAAALMSRGWKYLCDEFALINRQTHELHAFPKAICIKAGSFPVLDQLELPRWERKHYVKAFKGRVAYVKPSAISQSNLDQTHKVRRIVFPRYVAHQEPVLHEMSRSEATIQLAEMSFNRQVVGGDEAMRILTSVCRDAQCFRLETGDIHRSCEMIEALMREVDTPKQVRQYRAA
jgi:HprK-related kinase A